MCRRHLEHRLAMDTSNTSASYFTTSNSSDTTGSYSTSPTMSYITYAIGGVGLIGNTFVVIVIMKTISMRKQLANIYITNQGVIDALSSFSLILSIAFEDDGRTYHTLLDDLKCRMWFTRLPLWSLFTSSTYNLIILTMERYLSIVHPIWHKTELTKKKVIVSIIFVWLFGNAYNAAFILPTSGLTADGYCRVLIFWPNRLWRNAAGVLIIVIQYILPLFIFIFVYTRMVIKLRSRIQPTISNESSRSSHQPKSGNSMDRARKNTLKTLIMVVCSFILCWSWNQIYFLIFNLGVGNIDFSGIFYSFTVVMIYLNCCLNPFIYVAKYEEFQKATWRLFRKK